MGTARNNAARRAYIAKADNTERQQMARERLTGCARTFITSSPDNDLEQANNKAIVMSNLMRIGAHALGMSYDELRFALITSQILIDSNPNHVGKMCREGQADFEEFENNVDPAAAHDTCNRLTDLAAELAVKNGWRVVLATLLTLIDIVWDGRKTVDGIRLENESRVKLDELKDSVKKYRAGHPVTSRPIQAPPTGHDYYDQRNAVANPVVERHYRVAVPVEEQRPAPFTWDEYIRSRIEGDEAVINARLDKANAAAEASPFDDFPEIDIVDDEPIKIRDLDTGRTTEYVPPVGKSTRIFAASPDGSVTVRKAYRPEAQVNEAPDVGDGGAGARNRYWCGSCRVYHDRNETE